MEKEIMKRLNKYIISFQVGYFTSSNCIVYMIYSISGQKKHEKQSAAGRTNKLRKKLEKKSLLSWFGSVMI
ncbi:hypothetical protein BS614_04825 [Paenibacillus xylanexedens]|nr:hypothetical protein BS614_04825 [Paenibacillus xylanexedens]